MQGSGGAQHSLHLVLRERRVVDLLLGAATMKWDALSSSVIA